MPLIAVPDWVNTWATPLWLLGMGAILGSGLILVLRILAGILPAPWSERVSEGFRESPLVVINWVVALLAIVGLLTTFVVRDRNALLASFLRVPFTGQFHHRLTLAAPADDGTVARTLVQRPFVGTELVAIRVQSDNDLRVVSAEQTDGVPEIEFAVTGGEDRSWDRVVEVGNRFQGKQFTGLYIENLGDAPTDVELEIKTQPRHPQAVTMGYTALSILGYYLVYLLLRAVMPKMAAISLATAKSQIVQPLYLILLLLCCFLLCVFVFIPYNTFGEDIKVLKDSGLTLMLVCAVLQAVWAASTSVEDEIEGKTALTLLSKPIHRVQFILGKFFGIAWASAAFLIITGTLLMILVGYKTIYDARETSNPTPEWQQAHAEMLRLTPGVALALMETLIFVAISVAISTRLPLLANMTLCFVIYAFGHLTAQLVQAGAGRLENVKFMAQFIATALPVLDHFNIQAAIAKGADVPSTYVLTAGVYCLLYCTMALLLALVLFEDRDLA